MNGPLDLAPPIARKKERLLQILNQYKTLAVAFSGGVDSTFLLAAARKALPKSSVLAVTAVSPSLAEGHYDRCRNLVALLDSEWKVIQTEEFLNPDYLSNPSNRCYFCKSGLYSKMLPVAKEGGYLVMANGLNQDDLSDIRPGQQAAVESGVESPLRDVQLSKAEIRQISRFWGLPTWNDPEMPCLSSRVSFGTPVEPGLLQKIDRAEQSIRALGFKVVRVRSNGTRARIEIGKDMLVAALEPEMTQTLCRLVQDAGFSTVTLDRNGYEKGALHKREVGHV